jgi:hypothetical protein
VVKGTLLSGPSTESPPFLLFLYLRQPSTESQTLRLYQRHAPSPHPAPSPLRYPIPHREEDSPPTECASDQQDGREPDPTGRADGRVGGGRARVAKDKDGSEEEDPGQCDGRGVSLNVFGQRGGGGRKNQGHVGWRCANEAQCGRVERSCVVLDGHRDV